MMQSEVTERQEEEEKRKKGGEHSLWRGGVYCVAVNLFIITDHDLLTTCEPQTLDWSVFVFFTRLADRTGRL